MRVLRILFIRARLSPYDLVWIGLGDAQAKLAQLDAASPVPLELLGAVDAHPRRTIEMFKPVRERGQWHRATAALLEYVTEHAIDPRDLVPVERMLTVREAAQRLGVAPITIRRRVEAGDLPFIKIGKQIRFDPVELAKL